MNTRKDFLVATSLFAVAPAVADAASPSPKPANEPPALRFKFDETRFNEILAKPAKHKQCFGATKIDDANVVNGMANTINAYEQYLGEAPGSVQTAGVLYHGAAIALAMNDTIWNEMLFPSLKSMWPSVKEQFAGLAAGKGNPYKGDVAGIVSRGASFFVCHNAIAGFAGVVAGAIKEPLEAVHDKIVAGVLPGCLVVPAGVMAINACQEAKFTYIQSSL